jgi:hypothetical protein
LLSPNPCGSDHNQNVKKNKTGSFIQLVASPKLTVICLSLLVIVVIWGTVYQVDHGLYQAQQKFFHSWFVFLFGFIPFPAIVLLFWILFFNVLASLLFRIPFRLANIGNIITHLGILIFFVGGFFTFYYSQESSLSLREGDSSRFSISGMSWELAVWEEGRGNRRIYAVDSDRFRPGDAVDFETLGLRIRIESYYRNCAAYSKTDAGDESAAINASGIHHLKVEKEAKEPSENMAGMLFSAEFTGGKNIPVLLYGGDRQETAIHPDGKNIFFSLRKKRFPLPFSLKLIDFRRQFYPGSEIARSYESEVELAVGNLHRNIIISMNKPLRYKDFTLYQSSYYIAPDGTEFTFLAVVRNAGRLLPYISSIIIFLGLCIHFLAMLFLNRKKARKNRPKP